MYVIQLAITLVGVYFLSPIVAIAMGLLIPLFVLSSAYFGERLVKVSHDNLEDMEAMKSFVNDTYHLSKSDRFLTNKQMPAMKSLGEIFLPTMSKNSNWRLFLTTS